MNYPPTQLNSESDIIRFLSEIAVPAAIVTTNNLNEPIVTKYNNKFRQEFGLETHETPIELNNFTSGVETVDLSDNQISSSEDSFSLDIIKSNGTSYIRARMDYTRDSMLDIYMNSSENLPYKQHMAVLHRVYRHNLRNSINTILGWAESIRLNSEKEEVKQAASVIEKEGHDLARISDEAQTVRDILDRDTRLTRVYLHDVVDRALSEPEIEFKSANISVDIGDDVKIYSNKHLYFAIKNVIDNSFRHNDEDVSVDITTEFGESGEYVSLSITDDGGGLPDIEKRIITNDVSIDKLNHGDGLGLWIIKWATEMNNVEVDVITKDIRGTKFIFYFKLAE